MCDHQAVSLSLSAAKTPSWSAEAKHKFSVYSRSQYVRCGREDSGGGGHVRIMKLTPLWAGGPARTGNNCSGSTAGCWWCGCSSGPGRAHRARRSGLSSGENRPGSGGVAAARLPSFLNDNKLGVPACNAGWERGGGIGEVCLSLVQVVSRRVPWQRERAFGGEIFLSV